MNIDGMTATNIIIQTDLVRAQRLLVCDYRSYLSSQRSIDAGQRSASGGQWLGVSGSAADDRWSMTGIRVALW